MQNHSLYSLPSASSRAGGDNHLRDPVETIGSFPLRIADHLVIPLSLDEANPNLLSSELDGEVYSLETSRLMPSGNYIVHVFDTILEATAARKVMQVIEGVSLGNHHWSSAYECELPNGEACIVTRTNAPVHSDFVISCHAGDLAVQIQDCRLSDSDLKPISISPLWSAEALDDLYTNSKYLDINSRAKLVARRISDLTNSCTCLRLVQREIETIPGAYILISGISIEDVYEAMEDKLLDRNVKAYLPSAHAVHQALISLMPLTQPYSPSAVANLLADAFVRQIEII